MTISLHSFNIRCFAYLCNTAHSTCWRYLFFWKVVFCSDRRWDIWIKSLCSVFVLCCFFVTLAVARMVIEYLVSTLMFVCVFVYLHFSGRWNIKLGFIFGAPANLCVYTKITIKIDNVTYEKIPRLKIFEINLKTPNQVKLGRNLQCQVLC